MLCALKKLTGAPHPGQGAVYERWVDTEELAKEGGAVKCYAKVKKEPKGRVTRSRTLYRSALLGQPLNQLLQQLSLFGIKLILREDALGIEVAQLLKRGDNILGLHARCGWRLRLACTAL